jgi:filamentous hemagglutinin family protein
MKAFKPLVSLLMFTATPLVYSNPTGFETLVGEAEFSQISENTVQITTGRQAVINWKTFSIDKQETTRFVMPSASSSVLNRVLGGESSDILGSIEANGKVFLINPKGVFIGEDALIDTASFIASSYDLLNDEFILGKEIVFKGTEGSIINYGKIRAWDGDIVLIGYQVENKGSIEAEKGVAALAAGSEVLLRPSDNERILIRTKIDEVISEDLIGVQNNGVITALQAELKAEGNPYMMAIKDTGRIDALKTVEQAGRIFLVSEKGSVTSSGKLTAESGEVRLLGRSVVVAEGAEINVSGSDGGTVLIGGDFKGENPNIFNAATVLVENGALIDADAISNGDGGRVILWSDYCTSFNGLITARGGSIQGDGGFVEVSSRGLISSIGEVNTFAANGQIGTLLLDPCAVTISADLDSGFTLVSPPVTFDFTGSAASNINAVHLTTLLNANNVVIDASATGTAATGSIIVQDFLGWVTANSLTLRANDSSSSSIQILANVQGPQGTLNLQGYSVSIGDLAASLADSVTVEVNALNVDTTIFGGGSGGDFTLSGSAADNSSAQAIANTVDLTVLGNLNLQAGSGKSSFVALTSNSGGISGTVGGTTSLIGGEGLGSSAAMTSSFGDITLTSTGTILLRGSDLGSFSSAFIATYNAGNIELTTTAGDLLLTAGVQPYSSAQVYTKGTVSVLPASGPAPASSTITIDVSAGNLELQGGLPPAPPPAPALPTAGGDASIFTTATNSNVIITTSGDVLLLAGALPNTFAKIAAEASSLSITTTGIGADLVMESSLFEEAPNGYTLVQSAEGIAIDVAGSLLATGGAALQTFANLITTTGGNILIDSGDTINFSAGSSAAGNSEASILAQAGGTILMVAPSIALNGGTGVQSPVNIVSGSNSGSGSITILAQTIDANGTLPVPGTGLVTIFTGWTGNGVIVLDTNFPGGGAINLTNAVLSTSGQTGNNPILITGAAEVSLNSNVQVLTRSGDIAINALGSIVYGPETKLIARTPLGGHLSSIANLDMTFDATAQAQIIGTGVEAVFVVDNIHPTAPGRGNYSFVFPDLAKIDLVGTGFVRIYTSEREDNIIGMNAVINGTPYVPGLEFVDTATEEWGVYYHAHPMPGIGVPFTIYYKNTSLAPPPPPVPAPT